jgi:hypothetical protein
LASHFWPNLDTGPAQNLFENSSKTHISAQNLPDPRSQTQTECSLGLRNAPKNHTDPPKTHKKHQKEVDFQVTFRHRIGTGPSRNPKPSSVLAARISQNRLNFRLKTDPKNHIKNPLFASKNPQSSEISEKTSKNKGTFLTNPWRFAGLDRFLDFSKV